MPIYEYQCLACAARTEALQKMSDPPLTTCESCGGELKRLISSPAVQFKGSGWYVTDYARAGGKSGESKSGESKGGGESAASGSTAASQGESKSGGETKSGGESKSGAGESKSDKPAAAGSSTSGGGAAKAD